MANLLAIDTSTEACSVAMLCDGVLQERHELAPRRHNQRLFVQLADLLGSGRLAEHGIDALAYACGPGSFTGLRICASAVQGLCFANSLPALPVCTLLAQAQSAVREGLVEEGHYVLSTLDAHIGEFYWRLCQIESGRARAVSEARVARPDAFSVPELPDGAVLRAVGSGLSYREQLGEIASRWQREFADLLPRARDLLLPAEEALAAGYTQRANEVAPVYVRDEINWKKLHEQGKRA